MAALPFCLYSFSSSVLLKLGDLVDSEISLEAVVVLQPCKQPVGFMVPRRENFSPDWLSNLHLHEDFSSSWCVKPPKKYPIQVIQNRL